MPETFTDQLREVRSNLIETLRLDAKIEDRFVGGHTEETPLGGVIDTMAQLTDDCVELSRRVLTAARRQEKFLGESAKEIGV